MDRIRVVWKGNTETIIVFPPGKHYITWDDVKGEWVEITPEGEKVIKPISEETTQKTPGEQTLRNRDIAGEVKEARRRREEAME